MHISVRRRHHDAPFCVAAAFGAALLTTPAWAQEQCATRDALHEGLATKYNEQIIALGLANGGGLIEILSSPDGETWTILLTFPDGRSCIVSTGEWWRGMAPQPEGPKV